MGKWREMAGKKHNFFILRKMTFQQKIKALEDEIDQAKRKVEEAEAQTELNEKRWELLMKNLIELRKTLNLFLETSRGKCLITRLKMLI